MKRYIALFLLAAVAAVAWNDDTDLGLFRRRGCRRTTYRCCQPVACCPSPCQTVTYATPTPTVSPKHVAPSVEILKEPMPTPADANSGAAKRSVLKQPTLAANGAKPGQPKREIRNKPALSIVAPQNGQPTVAVPNEPTPAVEDT